GGPSPGSRRYRASRRARGALRTRQRGAGVGRLGHLDLDDAEWRLIGVGAAEQRKRHVVDRYAGGGGALWPSAMRVAVEHDARSIAVDGLLEPARAQERIDLGRLAAHGRADRRVVEQRDTPRRAKPGQRRLELEGLLDRGTDEGFGGRLAPGLQGPGAKAAREALGARKANALDLDRRPVQHGDAGDVAQDLHHLDRRVRFEVVI